MLKPMLVDALNCPTPKLNLDEEEFSNSSFLKSLVSAFPPKPNSAELPKEA